MAVVPPPPPPPNWINVVVYNLPYDAPNAYIQDALKFFGTIQNIRHQHWTHLREVATGTREVRNNLRWSIPRFIRICFIRCKVWYRGQPVYCDICREGTHIASHCPYKGKFLYLFLYIFLFFVFIFIFIAYCVNIHVIQSFDCKVFLVLNDLSIYLSVCTVRG